MTNQTKQTEIITIKQARDFTIEKLKENPKELIGSGNIFVIRNDKEYSILGLFRYKTVHQLLYCLITFINKKTDDFEQYEFDVSQYDYTKD